MKTQIVAFSLTGLLTLVVTAPTALAQDAPRGASRFGSSVFGRAPAAPAPPAPASDGNPAMPSAEVSKTDTRVIPVETVPEPTKIDYSKPATAAIALPTDAIEPYLLTKDQGPFMVTAKTFRGPDAERYALALVLELRRDYGLPAYILRTKDFPMRSNIRNVPPTAPPFASKAIMQDPEKVRSYDEAAVLIGNEKTLADSEVLWLKVKKIKPKCLQDMPNMFGWREGLSKALRTTNPYVPAQNLYPGRKKDNLISQMNSGPRSIFNCPGRYTLQVAEFSGRSLVNPSAKDPRFFDTMWLKTSPLVTAADDAERLAEALAKDPVVQATGAQPYVYHSRTSSKVMIGSFNNPNDPAASQLHDTLLKKAVELSYTKDSFGRKRAGFLIAPGNSLTDLQDPNSPIKTAEGQSIRGN